MKQRGGFRVITALMDGEFQHMWDDRADIGMILNTTARDEHVGNVERFIRTLKEQMRAIYSTLPFTRAPDRLTIDMAKYCIYWLNAFPHPYGVSDTLSPRSIVTGQGINFNRHCRFELGQYVQTQERHNNFMTRCIIGASMRPTGNAQGSPSFLSLLSGRVVNQSNATYLSMPDDVIDRVHVLARRQCANPGLVILDGNRRPMEDHNEEDSDDNDSNYSDYDECGDDEDTDSSYHHDESESNDDDRQEQWF